MRPLILDLIFNDDRMFVLGINRSKVTSIDFEGNDASACQYKWTITTRRNVVGLPPISSNVFNNKEEAIDYYKKVIVHMPRVSLGKASPKVAPSIDEYTEWLINNNLYDPLLNPKT